MESEYVKYKTLVTSIKSTLGLDCLDIWDTPTIHQYVLIVLSHINSGLVSAGVTQGPKSIKEFCQFVDLGNRILLEETLPDMYYHLGITDLIGPDWNDVLFGIAWTNVTTAIWCSLKCSYGSLLWDLEHARPECGCPPEPDPVPGDNLYSRLSGVGAKPHGCGCRGTA